MERNCITVAPEVDGVRNLYGKWKRYFLGDIEKFYEFMTTPSPDREEFMNLCRDDSEIVLRGTEAEVILRSDA